MLNKEILPDQSSTLNFIYKLCETLKLENINYCHWKSNAALVRSASGENDLDLLIDRADVQRFTEILYRLGCKQARAPVVQEMPGVLNYYGYDRDADKLVHIHAHYQLILGHDRTKNYCPPIERAFLASGLHLALEALGIEPGDEVIVPTYTFTSTAEVARYLGANPVFVDSDRTTFNIDPTKIEAAITPHTKAIIPVHIGGLACEMEPILQLAQKYGLKVVEDAAHAIPTTYRGQKIGSLASDATVYSFYATKTIATGEGGMLVTRNPEIANRCRVMRLHGINRDAFDRYTSTKPSWYYEIIAPGFKYNMTDVAASLGIHQLKKAWILQQQRAEIAQHYDAEFADLPLLLPPKPPTGDIHSWHLYIIRLQDSASIDRNNFIAQMTTKGIGCSVHYIPLHLHPYWRDTYHLQPNDFPGALFNYERAVSLPIYTKMTEADRERVIQSVQEILTKS